MYGCYASGASLAVLSGRHGQSRLALSRGSPGRTTRCRLARALVRTPHVGPVGTPSFWKEPIWPPRFSEPATLRSTACRCTTRFSARRGADVPRCWCCTVHWGHSTCSALLPQLAETRQVIAVEQQGHGRTADIDRPLSYEQMADDTAAFLEYLGVEHVDVFGFSMGGGVAWQLAIRHPDLVRKLVAGSATYTRAHGYYTRQCGIWRRPSRRRCSRAPPSKRATRRSPRIRTDFATLVRKVQTLTMRIDGHSGRGRSGRSRRPRWSSSAMPTSSGPKALRSCSACAAVAFRATYVGLPAARLAVLPGTTHMTAPTRTEWLRSMITEFLDAPMPEGSQSPGGPLGLIGAGAHERNR